MDAEEKSCATGQENDRDGQCYYVRQETALQPRKSNITELILERLGMLD